MRSDDGSRTARVAPPGRSCSRRRLLGTLGGTVAIAAGAGCASLTTHHAWTADVGGQALAVVREGDVVYASTSEGVHAIAADEGTVEWSVALGETIVGGPVVRDGTVYVAVWDGAVVAVADGARRWTHPVEGALRIAGIGDRVVAGARDGTLVCLDPDGGPSVAWRETVDGQVLDLRARDGRVFALADGGLTAVEHAIGRPRWGRTVAGGRRLAVDDDLLVATTGRNVRAFDPATGERRWEADAPRYGRPRLVTLAGTDSTLVLLGGRTDRAVALDAADGTLAWEHRLELPAGGEAAFGSPALLGDAAVFPAGWLPGHDAGGVVALGLADGEKRWSAGLDGPARGRPVTAAGRVLVPTDAGVVAVSPETRYSL